MLTKHEVFVLGELYGRLSRALEGKYDRFGGKAREAAMQPLIDFTRIHDVALTMRVIDKALDQHITTALAEVDIDHVDPYKPEPILPLEYRGSWDLGYYKGRTAS